MCEGAEGTEGMQRGGAHWLGVHIGRYCWGASIGVHIGKGCIGAHRLAAAAQKETYGRHGGANFEGEHSSKTQLRQLRSH